MVTVVGKTITPFTNTLVVVGNGLPFSPKLACCAAHGRLWKVFWPVQV